MSVSLCMMCQYHPLTEHPGSSATDYVSDGKRLAIFDIIFPTADSTIKSDSETGFPTAAQLLATNNRLKI